MRLALRLLVTLATAIASCGALAAGVGGVDGPVLLDADEIRYDSEVGVVTASGGVELVAGERVLRADTVSFNQRDDVVSASGNIALMESTGEVLFAEYMELSGDLRAGFIRDLRLLLADESRFAAAGGERQGGNVTRLDKAVYSPCHLCPEHPERPPLWQIKAVRVVHDQAAQTIDYNDAFLEVFGVPVLYTPFFSHPDPTLKRKTGLLPPEYGSSRNLGQTLRVPIFFNLAPHRDVTVEPLFTSKEGLVLSGEYRERTETGQYSIAGSITRPDRREGAVRVENDKQTRGHVQGTGRFRPNDTWRWGFDAARATDDTYLERYRIPHEETLRSTAFLDGTRGRNFASLQAFAFQELAETDDPADSPIVHPLADYRHIGDPNPWGLRDEIDLNMMLLSRSNGRNTRRLSARYGWSLPHVTPGGQVLTLGAGVRADGYAAEEVLTASAPFIRREDTTTGRVLPEMSFEWRYPFVRRGERVHQILEPIAMAVVSPYGGNPSEIPNEDSQDFEFDDNNLFAVARFNGIDRVEGGPRLNYGIRYGAYGVGGGAITVLLGQVLRAHGDDTFAAGSGLDDTISDLVGRVSVQPARWLDLAYRFRLDQQAFEARRNEVSLSAGPRQFNVGVVYVALDEVGQAIETNAFGNREEILLSLTSRITENWLATASARRDLTGEGRAISETTGIAYENECIVISVTGVRRHTRDRDVEPETGFRVAVRLKTLG